jgi:polyhydroxybutyrate depolymerase
MPASDPHAFERFTLEVDGRTREYLLHVPATGERRGPTPLVISLHGGGGHAGGVDAQSGWGVLAQREGFAVALPEGVGESWNDGRGDTPSEAVRQGVDDVGFLAALIADVARRTPIDEGRVYMNGISNGGFMTARFACERAGLVSAIGLVVATLGPDVLRACKPAQRVSVISFNGTADPLVPFEGGAVHLGRKLRGQAASAAEATALWTQLAGCSAPAPRDLPDVDADDGSRVHLDAYACASGAGVDAYTIVGGGHTWPGGKQYLPKLIVGRVNRDIDATQLMWTFFAAHPRAARSL